MKKRPVLGVGAVVIHEQRVLLVQRGNAPYRGMWCIPGGRVKYGESLQHAAEREILEETGIVIKAKQPVYTFEIIETENVDQAVHYVVIDLEADYVSGKIKPGDDALDARWFEKSAIDQGEVQLLTRNFLKSWWLGQ